MKTWIAFWASMIAILGALLFWRNTRAYAEKTAIWRAGKSLVDMSLILIAAFRLPVLLVSWCVLWLTRPIKNPAARTTAAVFAGLLFGLFGVKAIELLVLSSIFAIDLITGRQGFLKHWYQSGENNPEVAAAA